VTFGYWLFEISEILYEFPQISSTLLYETVTLSQVMSKMGSKNAHGCTQNAQNGFGFDFLDRYHEDDGEFLNHTVQVIGDETWVSVLNAETKQQLKQRMHTNSPNKPRKFKQMLSACMKADGNWFLGQERSADGGIHTKRDHNNVRSVL
jgi:hypothetical protein